MEKPKDKKMQWVDPELVKLGIDLTAVGDGCGGGSEGAKEAARK